ncbi:MAG: hypothetical protein H7242_11505 [Microbacteriaceae bacterium]|nr:hypothetical protein [Burkholderiaceae bacterium]
MKHNSSHFFPPIPTKLHFIVEIGGNPEKRWKNQSNQLLTGITSSVPKAKKAYKIGTCEGL